jgi:hypothetical protein
VLRVVHQDESRAGLKIGLSAGVARWWWESVNEEFDSPFFSWVGVHDCAGLNDSRTTEARTLSGTLGCRVQFVLDRDAALARRASVPSLARRDRAIRAGWRRGSHRRTHRWAACRPRLEPSRDRSRRADRRGGGGWGVRGTRQLAEVILEGGRKQHKMIVRVRLEVVGRDSDSHVLPQRETRSYP